jgi:FMN phosphatase YigB (HAD superfamily)
VSAELGLLKPDPAVYRKVASELGITMEQMVFVDNKASTSMAPSRSARPDTLHRGERAARLPDLARGSPDAGLFDPIELRGVRIRNRIWVARCASTR